MSTTDRTRARPDEAAQLAANVRRIRAARGLTLVQLAELTGISRATLSRIERGESVPSALVLGKLAAGLAASLSQLLGRQQVRRPVLLGPAEQPTFADPASGLVRRSLSPSFPDRALDLALNTLPAGRTVAFPPHQPGVEEYLHVLTGELWVTVGAKSFHVRAGHTLFYAADEEHVFDNRSEAEVAFLIMIDSRVSS